MVRLVGIFVLKYEKRVFEGKLLPNPSLSFLPWDLPFSDALPSTSLLHCRSWAPSFSSPPHHPHLIPHERLQEVTLLLLRTFPPHCLFFCVDHHIVASRSKTDPNFGLKFKSFAVSRRLGYPILPLSFPLQTGRFSSLVLLYMSQKIRSNDYDLYLFVSS